MMGDLLKSLRSSQIFSVCGLPEVEVRPAGDGQYEVELLGLDVFDPVTMEVEHRRSHLNYVVADTRRWEEQAAYYLDTNDKVDAFVKNQGLNFTIPYLDNGQAHDYVPDFIVRLKTTPPIHLILETKGFDPLEEVKRAAAERWVAAVNADGSYGRWAYAIARRQRTLMGLSRRRADGADTEQPRQEGVESGHPRLLGARKRVAPSALGDDLWAGWG